MEVPSPPSRNTSTCPTLLSSLLICRLDELGLEALGLWSARVMAHLGDGTPLPSASANRLVVAGPYRLVRNPMAVAGIVQAIGVGLLASSWLTLLYAVCGIAYWHALVRPFEEADLEARFGERFRAYRVRVGTWIPFPRSSTSTAGSGPDQSS